MGGHPGESFVSIGSWRPAPAWLAALGLLAALAALSLPGPAGQSTGIASVLAVGATALLAGFGWGALIVATADVLLLGKVWPVLAFAEGPESWSLLAASASTLFALPGLVLFVLTLPRMVEIILGGRGPMHRVAVGAASAAAAVYMVLPAFVA